MRKVFLLFSGVILAAIAYGQDTEKKTSKGKWERGASLAVHVGQGGSRNWAIGAEKFSIWTAASLNVFANRKSDKCYWDNNLQLNYGFVNTHSGGFRKTDDKIDFTTKPGLSLFSKAGVALLVNFRSQFYDGNNYNYLNQGLRRKISSFMAPGYLHVAPGFDWKPSSSFSILVTPISGKFTFVTNEPYSYSFQGGVIPDQYQTDGSGQYEKPLAINYGVDPQKEVRFEIGAFASANFNKEIVKNVSWKSKLDLFSGYSKRTEFFGPGFASQRDIDEFHPEKVDVYWTNSILMKVNKFLNVSYDFDLIYDDDVRMFGPSGNVAAMQFRSMLGVGVGVHAKF
ncbi:MAG TPA: DUF3078 domain-containing protein [Chitinophagaceae bacterium]